MMQQMDIYEAQQQQIPTVTPVTIKWEQWTIPEILQWKISSEHDPQMLSTASL